MIEIEFEEPHILECECCGKPIKKLTRFVYQDGDAFAVYYGQFTPSHNEKCAKFLIGIGEWDSEDEITMKYAFSLHLWQDDDNWNTRITDADECPWESDGIGKILQREEALDNKYIKDVYHISDHIVAEDNEIIDYFNAK